ASPSARTSACSESAIWLRRARISSTSWTIFVMQGPPAFGSDARITSFDKSPYPCRPKRGQAPHMHPWSKLGAKPQSCRPTPCRPLRRSKLANQSDQFALNIGLVRTEGSRLVVWIGRLERDRGTLLAQALEGGLLLFYQRHDDVAVLGGVAALADDDVALVDAGIDHRIAFHLQRERLSPAHHLGRHANILGVVLDGADRHAGGDAAHQRHTAGTDVGVCGWGRCQLRRAARAALDDVR